MSALAAALLHLADHKGAAACDARHRRLAAVRGAQGAEGGNPVALHAALTALVEAHHIEHAATHAAIDAQHAAYLAAIDAELASLPARYAYAAAIDAENVYTAELAYIAALAKRAP